MAPGGENEGVVSAQIDGGTGGSDGGPSTAPVRPWCGVLGGENITIGAGRLAGKYRRQPGSVWGCGGVGVCAQFVLYKKGGYA